jgi:hypothetical protein
VAEPKTLGADFLAVHEDPAVVPIAGGRVVEGGQSRKVSRAQPAEGRRSLRVRAVLPEKDVLAQVLAGDDRQVALVDDPLRDERAFRSMGTDGSEVLPSSWFMSTVKVPSPLSYAPSPSGIPTMRYPLTESPVVMMDFVMSPACERTT